MPLTQDRAQRALSDLHQSWEYYSPPPVAVNELLLHRERGAYLPYFDLR